MLTIERPRVTTPALMKLASQYARDDAQREAISEDAFTNALRAHIIARSRAEQLSSIVENATLALVTTYYGVAARALLRSQRRREQLALLEGAS